MKKLMVSLMLASLVMGSAVLFGQDAVETDLARLKTRLEKEVRLTASESENIVNALRNQYQNRVRTEKEYKLDGDTVIKALKKSKASKSGSGVAAEVALMANHSYNECLKAGISRKEATKMSVKACVNGLDKAVKNRIRTQNKEKSGQDDEAGDQQKLQIRVRNEIDKETADRIQERTRTRTQLKDKSMSQKEKAEAKREQMRGAGKGKGKRDSGTTDGTTDGHGK
ncbi:MAG: hypothetical protein PHF84_11515 [bacterium]|nr:hypothetical protein [bacterium]